MLWQAKLSPRILASGLRADGARVNAIVIESDALGTYPVRPDGARRIRLTACRNHVGVATQIPLQSIPGKLGETTPRVWREQVLAVDQRRRAHLSRHASRRVPS